MLIRILLLFLLVLGITMQTVAAKNILVFGDSLSAAYRINPDDGWVNLLQTKANQLKADLTFINASISGETTRGGLARIKQALKKHQPDIVILELGANDGLRGFPPKLIKQNLQRIITLAQKQNADILLVGVYLPPNYGKRYTEMFHNIYLDLAKLHHVTLLPYLLEGVGANKTLMQADGLHPSTKAQPLIADTVWKKLLPMVKKQSSKTATRQPAAMAFDKTPHPEL